MNFRDIAAILIVGVGLAVATHSTREQAFMSSMEFKKVMECPDHKHKRKSCIVVHGEVNGKEDLYVLHGIKKRHIKKFYE